MRARDRGSRRAEPSNEQRRGDVAPGKRTTTEQLPGRSSGSEVVEEERSSGRPVSSFFPSRDRSFADEVTGRGGEGGAGSWEATPDLMRAFGLEAPAAAASSSARARASGATAAPARPEDRYVGPQAAPTYFGVHREQIFAAIRDRLVGVALPAPHKRLAWTARGERLAEAFEAAWLEASDGVFQLADKLPALLHPADPWRLIDEHRDLTRGQPGELLDGEPAKGSLEWSPVVGAALALEVEAQLRSAVPRMGRRYVAQAEGGGGAVTVGMLVTSHPFDRIVARLLCAPGVVQLTRVASSKRGRRGGGRGEGGRDSADLGDASEDFRDGLRMVSFEWQGERDPALWNWVRVVEPADARKEEVAMAVFDRLDGENHTELAYGLTGSSPFFQVPPRWAKDLPGAREHAPRRAGAALEPADGLEAAEQRSGLALADSVLGDEAAEAQARRRREGQREEGAASTTPGLSRLAELLERSAAQLTLVLARLGPWHLYGLTGPALRWIARHREALISAPESTLQRWAPIIEEQQALLFDATGEISEVLDATAHLEPISSSAQAQPARAVVQAYAIAMGESHLVESAAAQLAVARRCKAELPLRMLELSLRESRATAREAGAASSALVDASKGASTSEARAPGAEAAGASASGAAAAGATGSRLASQPGMEWSALAQREASVTGRPIDPHAVSALAVAAAESAHRHRISALDDRLAALQLQVGHASEGVVATLANLFHGELRRLPGTLLRVQRAARQTVASMDARTQAWMEEHAGAAARGGEAESRRFSEALVEERRKNLAQARRELAELAEREDLQRLFQHAVDTIRDAATYTLVFEAALLIGVAVVGTFAGAAVGGLVRGAMLADVAVDSAAFYRGAMLARGLGSAASLGTDAAVNALGQTALGGGEESTARAFAVNLLSSAAVIAALRPLQGAARDWAVLDDKAQKVWTVAGGKRVLAQGAVLGAEMIAGAAIGYAVEQAMPRARAGKPAGEEEATSWLIQGAAMGAGRFVSGRLQGLQERLGAMAEGAMQLRKRAAAQAALAARVEETGDSVAALRLLDEHTQLLRDEAALLDGRPGAGALALGVDAQQLATLRAGNAAALVETESSAVSALRLHFAGLEPLSATGTMWAGTRSQIEAALAAAGPTARNVHHDALRRRWTAELAGKRIELAEVASGGAAARAAGHAEPPARAPRGAAPHRREPAPAHEEASQRATGEMAAVDPHAAELARIRNGPPGKIRDEGSTARRASPSKSWRRSCASSPPSTNAMLAS